MLRFIIIYQQVQLFVFGMHQGRWIFFIDSSFPPAVFASFISPSREMVVLVCKYFIAPSVPLAYARTQLPFSFQGLSREAKLFFVGLVEIDEGEKLL